MQKIHHPTLLICAMMDYIIKNNIPREQDNNISTTFRFVCSKHRMGNRFAQRQLKSEDIDATFFKKHEKPVTEFLKAYCNGALLRPPVWNQKFLGLPYAFWDGAFNVFSFGTTTRPITKRLSNDQIVTIPKGDTFLKKFIK